MVQRLFLNRIDAETAGSTIRRQNDFAVQTASHKAETALPLSKLAIARAEIALNPAIGESVPISRCDYTPVSGDFLVHVDSIRFDGSLHSRGIPARATQCFICGHRLGSIDASTVSGLPFGRYC